MCATAEHLVWSRWEINEQTVFTHNIWTSLMNIRYSQILSLVNRQSAGGDNFSQNYLFTIWKHRLCSRSTSMSDKRLHIISIFKRYHKQWRQVWAIYSISKVHLIIIVTLLLSDWTDDLTTLQSLFLMRPQTRPINPGFQKFWKKPNFSSSQQQPSEVPQSHSTRW